MRSITVSSGFKSPSTLEMRVETVAYSSGSVTFRRPGTGKPG